MWQKNLSQYKVWIFDCDGVILDSNEIKSLGFVETLKEFHFSDVQIQWAVDYHKNNGGVPRDTKFYYILSECGVFDPETQADWGLRLVNQACQLYSKHVRERVCACEKVPGIKRFLEKIPNSAYVYVVSGAKQEELREALHVHDLAPYFQGVFGSGPMGKSKRHWLDDIKEWLPEKEINGIYFGDSILDYEVAKENDLEFIFVSGVTDLTDWKEFCSKNKISYIEDFQEV